MRGVRTRHKPARATLKETALLLSHGWATWDDERGGPSRPRSERCGLAEHVLPTVPSSTTLCGLTAYPLIRPDDLWH